MKTEPSKNHKSGSLFRLLAGQYALFTLIVIGLMAGLIQLFWLGMDRILQTPAAGAESRFYKLLAAGDYARADPARLLGTGARLEVLDENGTVVYASSGAPVAAYSAADLACIPDADHTVYATSFTDPTGGSLTAFSFSSYSSEEGEDSGLLVVDSSRKVVYSSVQQPGAGGVLTARQFQLLSGEPDGFTLQRVSFSGQGGKAYTALLFQPATTEAQWSLLDLLNRALLPCFAVGYLLVVLGFVSWLNRKVKKPLGLLANGMAQLADGSSGAQLSYRGPVEFEQMCVSFNQLSRRLCEAQESRRRAEADKQKMLADISHDLKTPITVIQGYSKAICDGLIPPEQTAACLSTIYQKSTALTGLINTFYDYSRLEHPDFALVPVRRDLCEYLRGYLAEKYTEIELSGFTLEVQIPDAPLFCRLDEVQLRRVFENILANALKHNPPGTALFVSLEGPLSGEDGRRFARIVLADAGCGIPERLRDSVFEPFVVGDDSRATRQGSGLGLAISRRVAEAHGGSLQLLPPADGWATRFELCLPLVF